MASTNRRRSPLERVLELSIGCHLLSARIPRNKCAPTPAPPLTRALSGCRPQPRSSTCHMAFLLHLLPPPQRLTWSPCEFLPNTLHLSSPSCFHRRVHNMALSPLARRLVVQTGARDLSLSARMQFNRHFLSGQRAVLKGLWLTSCVHKCT